MGVILLLLFCCDGKADHPGAKRFWSVLLVILLGLLLRPVPPTLDSAGTDCWERILMSLNTSFNQGHRFDQLELKTLAKLNREGERQLLTLFWQGEPVYQAVMECQTIKGGASVTGQVIVDHTR